MKIKAKVCVKRSAAIFKVVLLLVLLSSIALAGIYSQGNVKNITPKQFKELEYGVLSGNAKIVNVTDSIQIKQLSDFGVAGVIVDCFLLLLIYSAWIYRSKSIFLRKNNLVSLCVRKDE